MKGIPEKNFNGFNFDRNMSKMITMIFEIIIIFARIYQKINRIFLKNVFYWSEDAQADFFCSNKTNFYSSKNLKTLKFLHNNIKNNMQNKFNQIKICSSYI